MTNIVGGDCRPNGQHLDSDALGGWYRHCKRARRVEPAKQLAGLGAFAQVEAAESAGCAACEHINLSRPGERQCHRTGRSRAPILRWFLGPQRPFGVDQDTKGASSLHLDFCERIGVVFLIAAPPVVGDLKAQAHVRLVGVAFLNHAFQHGSNDQQALSVRV